MVILQGQCEASEEVLVVHVGEAGLAVDSLQCTETSGSGTQIIQEVITTTDAENLQGTVMTSNADMIHGDAMIIDQEETMHGAVIVQAEKLEQNVIVEPNELVLEQQELKIDTQESQVPYTPEENCINAESDSFVSEIYI